MRAPSAAPPAPAPATAVAPRPRVRSTGDLLRFLTGLALVGIGMLAAVLARATIEGIEEDVARGVGYLPDRVEEALFGFGLVIAAALPLLGIVVLVVRHRFVLAFSLVVASWLAGLATAALVSVMVDWGVIVRRDGGATEVSLGLPQVVTSPLVASSAAVVVGVSPWVTIRWRRALWGVVALLAVVRIVGATEPPLDLVVALGAGLAVGALFLLVAGVPSFDPDAQDLGRILESAGIDAVWIEQLTGAGGPLLYRVERAGQHTLLLRLWTPHDRSADLLERLWQRLRLREPGPALPVRSLRHRIEHEALALSVARAGGARVPILDTVVADPSGLVGLVSQDTAARPLAELGDGQLDDRVLEDVWRQLDLLHRQRVAHGELDLRHLERDAEGRTWLVGFGQASVAADDRALGTDVAQLLVDLALVVGPNRAVQGAAQTLGRETLSRALPYLQPLALPGRTRAAVRRRKDVLEAVRGRTRDVTGAPDVELARLDRFRPRTLMMFAAIGLALYILLPQLGDLQQTIDAVRDADWLWLPAMLGAAALTYAFGALALMGSVPPRIRFWPTVRAQVASDFVTVITPGSTGSLAVGVRYLQRTGIPVAAATASVGVNAVGGMVVHLVLLVAFFAWTGTSGINLPSLPDTEFLLLGVGVVLAIVAVVAAVPQLRARMIGPALQAVRSAGRAVRTVATNPVRVLELIVGSAGVTLSYIVVLVAVVEAFGGGLSFPQIGAAYLGAAIVGSVAPTPGGLGALELALVAALSGFGLDKGTAVSAVLAFRLLTYWLPTIPGWFMFHWMERNREL